MIRVHVLLLTVNSFTHSRLPDSVASLQFYIQVRDTTVTGISCDHWSGRLPVVAATSGYQRRWEVMARLVGPLGVGVQPHSCAG
jgi:hypothetical protein